MCPASCNITVSMSASRPRGDVDHSTVTALKVMSDSAMVPVHSTPTWLVKARTVSGSTSRGSRSNSKRTTLTPSIAGVSPSWPSGSRRKETVMPEPLQVASAASIAPRTWLKGSPSYPAECVWTGIW